MLTASGAKEAAWPPELTFSAGGEGAGLQGHTGRRYGMFSHSQPGTAT